MDERKKVQREKNIRSELLNARTQAHIHKAEFADLKEKLKEMTRDEWEMIPEVIGDSSLRYKQQQKKTFIAIPAPDSLLASSLSMGSQSFNVTDQSNVSLPTSSLELEALGTARGSVLAARLQKNDLNSASLSHSNDDALAEGPEIVVGVPEDSLRFRKLFKSMIKTNPKHSGGWLALARVEAHSGNLKEAKKILENGISHCPLAEDLWLEWVGLEKDKSKAKAIIAAGLKMIGDTSAGIWIEAIQMENESTLKRQVIRKALDSCPKSASLWDIAAKHEAGDPPAALKILEEALVQLPHTLGIWMGTISLTYRVKGVSEAQKVVNQARKTLPDSPEIWIAAAKLVERSETSIHGEDMTLKKLTVIIQKAIASLAVKNVILSRDSWIQFAVKAVQSSDLLTAKALIRATLNVGIDEEDESYKRIWKSTAKTFYEVDYVVGRMLFQATIDFLMQKQRSRKSVWRLWIEAEETRQNDLQSTVNVLEQAVQDCPQALEFVLRLAKFLWVKLKNPEKAIAMLKLNISKTETRILEALQTSDTVSSNNLSNVLLAATIALGKVLISQKEFKEAESVFLRFLPTLATTLSHFDDDDCHDDLPEEYNENDENKKAADWELSSKRKKIISPTLKEESSLSVTEKLIIVDHPRVWLSLVQLHRQLSFSNLKSSYNHSVVAARLCETAIEIHNDKLSSKYFWKLHCIRYQLILEQSIITPDSPSISPITRQAALNCALESINKSLKVLDTCESLWISCCELNLELYGPSRARAILDRARLTIGSKLTPNLMVAAIEIETRAALLADSSSSYFSQQISPSTVSDFLSSPSLSSPMNAKHFIAGPYCLLGFGLFFSSLNTLISSSALSAAQAIAAKCVSDYPADGNLQTSKIMLEPVKNRKLRCAELLQEFPLSPHLHLLAARLNVEEGDVDRANGWFFKCIELFPQFGDGWGFFVVTLLQRLIHSSSSIEALEGDVILLRKIIKSFENLNEDPNKGWLWIYIFKANPSNWSKNRSSHLFDFSRQVLGDQIVEQAIKKLPDDLKNISLSYKQTFECIKPE